MADPQALASNALKRQLSPYPKSHIRHVTTYAEDLERLEKLKREDVQRLYQEQLGGQVGEIALVGDFDADAVAKQLETIFAGWKSPVAYERIPRQAFPDVKAAREIIQTPDKENAIFLAGQTFAMRDTDPDYPGLVLGNYVLGGSGFTSRLMQRLRQKEGWSYGAGSQLPISAEDKVGVLVVYAICNPTVIDKVDAGAAEEIARLLKTGVTTEEFTAAQKGYLESMKVSRGSDSTVASMLQNGLYLGRTFAFTADLQKKIAALEAKDVNRALAAHINPNRLVVVRAGDFSKKKAPQKK
jgi:zinc protease